MLIQDFLGVVASYMGKDEQFFNEGNNVDKLLLAANNAKKFTQRRLEFELSKCSVSVPINFTRNQDGSIDEAIGDLRNAVDVYDRVPVDVKKIRFAWLTQPNGTRFPLRIWSDKAVYDRVRRRMDLNHLSPHSRTIGSTQDPLLARAGNHVFLYPSAIWIDNGANMPNAIPTAPGVEVRMDVFKWLLPYGKDENDPYTVQNDFMLDYCSDYLLYRMVTELNFFVKEDQRVSISQGKMQEAYDSVLAWNDTMVDGDENLD